MAKKPSTKSKSSKAKAVSAEIPIGFGPARDPKTEKLAKQVEHLRLTKEKLRHQKDIDAIRKGQKPESWY